MGVIDSIKKSLGVGGGEWAFSIGGQTPHSVTRNQALKHNVGVVYACVSAISQEVGKFQPVLKDKSGDIVEKHVILDLLHNPNPEQRITQFNLFELGSQYTLLQGEFFWYVVRGKATNMPMRLYQLRPDAMQVVLDGLGHVVSYIYTNGMGKQVPLTLEEVIHHKKPDPSDPSRGLGVIAAGQVQIQTDQYAARWTRNFIFNNARPAGIVSIKGKVDKDVFAKVKRNWEKEYGTVDNAGKIMFMREGDLSYVKVGAGLDEVSLKELKDMTRDDIMMLFRVSKPMLGIVDDVNLANGKNAKKIFIENVIKPEMDRIVDTLNSYFQQYFPELTIDYVNPAMADPADKADYYKTAADVWMTRNEIRSELGLADIENGDSLMIPTALLPLGDVVPDATASQKSVKATVTVKTTTTKKDKPKVKKDMEMVDVEEQERKAAEALKERIGEQKLMMWKQAKQTRLGWEKAIVNATKKIAAKQKADMLKKMTPTKSAQDKVVTWLFDVDEYQEDWNSNLLPVFVGLAKEQSKLAFEQIGVPPVEISKDLVAQLEKSVARIGQDVDAQTIESLTDRLVKGIEDGDSISKLKGYVEDEFSSLDVKGYRAERIARTESVKVSNKAALDAYRETGVITHKYWYANPDACAYCQSMESSYGKDDAIELDANFLNKGDSVSDGKGGEYVADYEDVETADLHPNCECKIMAYNQAFEETGRYFFGEGE